MAESELLSEWKKLMLNDDGGEDEALPKVLEEVSLDGIVKHVQKLSASDNRESKIELTTSLCRH